MYMWETKCDTFIVDFLLLLLGLNILRVLCWRLKINVGRWESEVGLHVVFKAGADFCSCSHLAVHHSLSCTSVATIDIKNDPVYTSKIWKMLLSALNKGFFKSLLTPFELYCKWKAKAGAPKWSSSAILSRCLRTTLIII